jgi:CheY-like chemotaxis protein
VIRSLKPRILCIDDEPSVGAMIRAVFESTGDFTVETETNSFQALAHARRFHPDLILLDIRMPGQDGYAIAKQLREEPGLRHRPIIFFSGMPGNVEVALKAARGGPAELIEKGTPFAIIEEAIRRHTSERLALYLADKKAREEAAQRTAPPPTDAVAP